MDTLGVIDKDCTTVETFKALVKSYTAKGVYKNIGSAMRAGEFDRIQSYLAGIMDTA